MRRRVVITGLGVVSATGAGTDALWKHLAAGETALEAAPPELAAAGARVVGRASGVAGAAYLRNERHTRLLNRSFELLIAAGALAAADAALVARSIPPSRLGVSVGIGSIEQQTPDVLAAMRAALEAGGESEFADAARSLYPLRRLRLLPNIGAALLSIEHHAMGPGLTFVSGHAGGLQAVAEAAAIIGEGRLDAALCGGVDAQLTPLGVRLFGRVCELSPSCDPRAACRSFDRSRGGVVPGEGAAILVLEAEDSARARGVEAYGELVSCASARAAAGGCATAMRRALDAAGRRAAEVVIAHGEGGVESDRCEAAALGSIESRWITALPATIGHTMSACGALNLAAACLVLANDTVPPIAGLAAPAWSLPFVREAVHGRFKSVLVNVCEPNQSAVSAVVAQR